MIAWSATWWILITIAAIYSTLCMALSLILRNGGRSAIERRLAAKGRDVAWQKMEPRRSMIAHATALESIIVAKSDLDKGAKAVEKHVQMMFALPNEMRVKPSDIFPCIWGAALRVQQGNAP